jgi:hypothetical protein
VESGTGTAGKNDALHGSSLIDSYFLGIVAG